MNAFKFIMMTCCVISLAACSQAPSKKIASNAKSAPTTQISEEARQFFKAIKTGNTQAALDYVQSGEPLNIQDDFGHTGAFLAVDYRNLPLLDALIKKGAPIDMPNKQGWTPLMKAVEKHETEMVKRLLAANANPNTPAPDGWTALHLTMNPLRHQAQNYVEIAQRLIDEGAFVNQTRKDGVTPLFLSVLNNRSDIFNTLLAANANPNIANIHGITPLMQATYDHRVEMVKALLDAGANPNETDREGLSALHYTVHDPKKPQQDYADIAQILIDKGANINLQTVRGSTPLFYAVLNNRPEVFVTLLKANADASLANFNKWSPLMQAIRDENTPMINALVKIQERQQKNADNALLNKIVP